MVAKTIELPNIRELFLPDDGYVICEADLQRADLQVVVWEADDEPLKAALREGKDTHNENARALFGANFTPQERTLAKNFCHGTNYGATARTLARILGLPVAQVETLQERWFAAHPGIRKWHDRTQLQLASARRVENRFGYRRIFLDRPESCFTDALAWIPQSTVGIVINIGWERLEERFPKDIEVLLQVHDSLIFQLKETFLLSYADEIKKTIEVEIPYPDPLTIPVDLAYSDSSWGEVKKLHAA